MLTLFVGDSVLTQIAVQYYMKIYCVLGTRALLVLSCDTISMYKVYGALQHKAAMKANDTLLHGKE